MNTFSVKKNFLFQRTTDLFTKYQKFAIVNLNNITSSQLQRAKKEWYGEAEFLFGKNTTINKALEKMNRKDISSKINGNVAIIFTNEIKKIKNILNNNSRDTVAKVGAFAQKDVFIDKQLTSMAPDKTSFFSAMDISTKITKGKVEITKSCLVLKKNEKVTPSQANLLKIMNILPFTYSLKLETIYENNFYEPWIVDINENDIQNIMKDNLNLILNVSVGLDIIVKPSVPFFARNALKNAVGLSLGLGIKNKLTENLE